MEEKWHNPGDTVLEVSAEKNWYVIRCGVADDNGGHVQQDVSGYGDIELVFGSGDGEVRVKNTDMEGYSPQQGECVFCLERDDAGRVRRGTARDWRIVLGGVSIFTGKWRKSEEAAGEDLTAKIKELQGIISEKQKAYDELSAESSRTEEAYKAQIESLQNALTAAQQEAQQYAEELENLRKSMTTANVVEAQETANTAVVAKLPDTFRLTDLTKTAIAKEVTTTSVTLTTDRAAEKTASLKAVYTLPKNI